MATLSRWARARGLNVVHVSPDKDMLQLIEPGVHVMVPWSREMVGADEVESRYGVPPKQLVDLQSLVGDRADNVPGVAGMHELFIVSQSVSQLVSRHRYYGVCYI